MNIKKVLGALMVGVPVLFLFLDSAQNTGIGQALVNLSAAVGISALIGVGAWLTVS